MATPEKTIIDINDNDSVIQPLLEKNGHAEGEATSSASADTDSEIQPLDEETGHAEGKKTSSASTDTDPEIQPLHEENGHAEGEATSLASTDIDSETELSGADDSAAPPEELTEAEAAVKDFLNGDQHNHYRPLYHAANRGDWETAKRFIDGDRGALVARITERAETVLHVAARACQWEFVLRLVEHLSDRDLAIQDVNGRTALHYTAIGGNLRTAKALVRKNSDLPNIPDKDRDGPITSSLKVNPSKELVWYLLLVTGEEHFTSATPDSPGSGYYIDLGYLCYKLCKTGFHDIILYLLHRHPNLVSIEYPRKHRLLSMLLLTPSNFLSGTRLTFWERWIYQVVHVEVKTRPPKSMADVYGLPGNTECLTSKVLQRLRTLLWRAFGNLKLVQCIRNVVELKSRHIYAVQVVKHVCEEVTHNNFQEIKDFIRASVLFEAVELGVVEILEVCTHYFPDLIFIKDREGCSLFDKAILERQERMFDFLMNKMPLVSRYSTGYTDKYKRETTMHIAANLPPSSILASVPGAALQMQKELQWFKAVENLCTPNQKRTENEQGETAMEVFTEKHKDLLKKGEKWMKDTSTSGMLVATLIATVVFAGAFTVPGPNVSNTGAPIFLRENSLIMIIVSESLALFSSITSLLMFLSVITARYTEDDFLFSLPNKIIIGLGSLFLAIVSMMAAFGSTLYIVLNERWRWVSLPIIVLAAFPVTLFVILQLPLFFQMVNSTYGGGVLGNKKLREFQNKLE